MIGLDRLGAIPSPEFDHRRGVEGQVDVQVALENLGGRFFVGPLDLDLHVEASRSQDRRVDQVLAVGRADDDDVAQRLHAVDFGE